MALSLGIVGLPNVGKSTLFNALTKARNAEAANYPFCTIEPNKATVPVPDGRLDALTALVRPKKTVFASVDFIDIAGLVRGASKGEGLGNRFLANIRECAALVEVLRCFEDENIVHPGGGVDPVRDAETVETELLLADLESVGQRLERLQKQAKGDRSLLGAVEGCLALREHLDGGRPASAFAVPEHNEAFRQTWQELSLLTAKTIIYCANVDEAGLAADNGHVLAVREMAQARGAETVKICARLEADLQDLPAGDQREMLDSYGVGESGLENVIRIGYRTLGLASFFTAGPKEARAWTFRQGWKAPQAAGVIHSDFEKGFIRAEVIRFEDYMLYKTEAACRASGVLRLEGRDYVVRDGDVMHFLFNV
jgi:GTP-binding protein YchF